MISGRTSWAGVRDLDQRNATRVDGESAIRACFGVDVTGPGSATASGLENIELAIVVIRSGAAASAAEEASAGSSTSTAASLVVTGGVSKVGPAGSAQCERSRYSIGAGIRGIDVRALGPACAARGWAVAPLPPKPPSSPLAPSAPDVPPALPPALVP